MKTLILGLAVLSLFSRVEEVGAQWHPAPDGHKPQPTGVILGAVHNKDGNPVPDARVDLADIVLRQTTSVTSDSSGHFKFGNLLPGQYQVQAFKEGHSSELQDVKVSDAPPPVVLTIK